MSELSPFFRLYRQNSPQLFCGILLAFLALLASICLLALSGWFLSATALAGLSLMTAQTFNFFTPGAGVRGLSIMRTATRYFERLVNHDATFRLLSRLRVSCYAKLEPLTPNVLNTYREGDILNRLVADIDTLDHLYLRLISPFVCAILSCCFVVALAFIFSGAIALALSIIFLISIVALPPVLYFLGNHSGAAMSDSISHVRIRILDYISGHTDLVINGAEATYKEAILKEEQTLHALEEKMAHLSGLSSALITLTGGIALLIVLYMAASAVHSHTISGPIAAMLALATLASFEAIMPLPLAMQVLGKVKRSAARINELTQQTPTVIFPENPDSAKTVTPETASITFNQLCYRYPNSHISVLKALNLHINPGEKLAITGYTGCGKSTLLNLLTRTDNINSGDICINNRSIIQYSEAALRRSMAVMPQRIHIFSGTLRDNLRLACPAVTDEQLLSLLESLDLQQLSKIPETLLDTWVGEGGRMLSGGETRRIGIARVLLQDAPIVVLDEPSEGLDAITEHHALSVLADYCKYRTVIAVTHRPAILKHMDRIIPWRDLQAM